MSSPQGWCDDAEAEIFEQSCSFGPGCGGPSHVSPRGGRALLRNASPLGKGFGGVLHVLHVLHSGGCAQSLQLLGVSFVGKAERTVPAPGPEQPNAGPLQGTPFLGRVLREAA